LSAATRGQAVTPISGIAALLPFAAPARWQFALAGLLATAATVLSLVPFWAIYRTVSDVIDQRATLPDLWGLALLALLAVVGRFVLLGLSIWVAHLAAYDVLHGLRVAMADHLTRVPLGYLTRRRSGDIKKVMGQDVERLELFLGHGIPDLFSSLVSVMAIAIWMLLIDWRMALAVFVLALPAWICLWIAMRNSSGHMAEYHRTLGAMNASIVELVRGMPVVKVFNRGHDQVRDAQRSIDEHVRAVMAYALPFLPFGTAFYVLLASNVVVIVPLGIWLWSGGSLSTTNLLFFFIVGLGALAPLVTLMNLFSNLAFLATGGNLVRGVLEAAVLDASGSGADLMDASVELRNVSFAYDQAQQRVLHDVSLRAEPGSITALVGPSGGGKSTIASLIARFWDVDAGAVLVGGVDVRRLHPEALLRSLAVVFQDTFLFDDTVAGNLRVARPHATLAELEAACRAARAHDFVAALPDGYATPIGERGARLSAGERQRLAFARAILADAPIVILDEATAFADPENEAAIQAAIDQLVVGKTLIMIAHRLSTIVGADQILVIDAGRVVEAGRHTDLLARGGRYAALWHDFIDAESIARDAPEGSAPSESVA
jgi:ATP-binding cassette, subfamily B, bacterial IrtA/YbtP